jgi:hypothetical protein
MSRGLQLHARFATIAPMKRILDSSFRYQPSYATDVKKTFARARQRQQRASEAEEPRKVKVVVLDKLKRVGER